jgi:ABC-type phosphate/phosphonate transport system substrate-binding protein
MGYGGLEIQHGLVAAIDFGRMVSENTPIDEKEKIREALLAYCEKDTEAMVRIFDVLYSMNV